MKKRLSFLILLLALVSVTLPGCAGTTRFSFIRAWVDVNGEDYERAVYDVVRTDGDGTVIATGTQTVTIEPLKDTGAAGSADSTDYVQTVDFTLTYVAGDFAGKTDKILSEITFGGASKDILVSKTIEKTIDYETNAEKNMELSGEYKSGLKLTHNYKTEDGKMSFGSKEVSSSTSFDNELMLLVIRCSPTDDLKPGSTLSYSIVSPEQTVYDKMLALMSVNISVTDEKLAVPEDFVDTDGKHIITDNGATDNPDDDSMYIPCYKTVLSLPGESSLFPTSKGPPITAYFSSGSAASSEPSAQKLLLMKYVQEEYDVNTAAVKFRNTYTIREVVNAKPSGEPAE